MFLSSFSLLLLAILGHASTQSVLGLKHPVANPYAQSAYAAPYDDGLFTPVEDLRALSTDRFTILRHPMFPTYSVRIQPTTLDCDTSKSQAYSGYIDNQGRHIFFSFFESRGDPSKDDIVFWTNGGPGCASSVGMFMENGPCKFKDSDVPSDNPYSWTTNANVFWVDQPIGVGYSYADDGISVGTTEEAAKDIATFLAIFFEHFTSFQKRPFHMAGESYGGHYLPIFAAQVYDQNAHLTTPINLTSVMIGNGLVDYFTLYPTYITVQCTTVSGISPPVSNISTCLEMKKALPLCQKWTRESCIDRFDAMRCRAARSFCDEKLSDPFSNSGMNVYDISKKCDPKVADGLCYPVIINITNYLSLDSTRELLHVDPTVPKPFQTCNNTVGDAFDATLDEFHETYTQVSQLLERGVRVLVYVGTYDWICNWISNEIWTLQMPWTGQEEFVKQPLTDWSIDGVGVVGKTRSANGLTYATVNGAGHMVPYDKPQEALVLVQKWLEDQPL